MSAKHHAHRLFVQSIPLGGIGEAIVTDEEAHHAVRVKRVGVGELVELIDGQGAWAAGLVASVSPGKHPAVTVRISESGVEPRPERLIEIWSACPRPERLEQMIDQLSQVGAHAWRPLLTRRSEHEVTAARRSRLVRIAVEAAKQCGRRWLLDVGEPIEFEAAVRDARAVFADATGSAHVRLITGGVCVCVGPEGGWHKDERDAIAASGRAIWRLGPHVMRIETAAVAGALAAGGVEDAR